MSEKVEIGKIKKNTLNLIFVATDLLNRTIVIINILQILTEIKQQLKFIYFC